MANAATIGKQTNFGSILDLPSSEVEKPKPYPVGTYQVVVEGLPRFDKSSKKQTEFAEFKLNFLSAGEDVDAEALEEVGGIQGKSIKNTYYLTEGAVWRLKEFLLHLGIEEEDKSLRQMLEETPGRQCMISIRHEASEDGQSVFARISGTAPVAE
jgi:hypothetical protein